MAGLFLSINIAKKEGLKKIWLCGIVGSTLSFGLWICSWIPMAYVAGATFVTVNEISSTSSSTTFWLGFTAFISGSIVISLVLTNVLVKQTVHFLLRKSTPKE